MKHKIADKKALAFDLLIILALSIAPFSRLGFSGVIEFNDANFPFRPIAEFARFTYIWKAHTGMGFDNSIYRLNELPYAFILASLRWIGLPLGLINRMAIILPLFLAGSGMYYLTSVTLGKGRIAGLASGIFLISNPRLYRLLMVWRYTFAFSFIPLGLIFLINGLRSRGAGSYRNAIYMALISPFLSSRFIPLYLFLVLTSAYVLFLTVLNRKTETWVHRAKFCALALCLSLLANLWWLAPSFNKAFAAELPIYEPYVSYVNQTTFQTSWLDALHIGKTRIDYLYSTILYPTASSPDPLSLMAFWWPSTILFVLAVSALMLKRGDKHAMFFSILFLVSVFLAKGIHPPFGGVYTWLFLNLPGFSLFREVTHFQTLLLIPYAFLLGVAISEIHERIRASRRALSGLASKILTALCFALILVNGAPFLMGDLFAEAYTRPYGTWLPMQPPTYYEESTVWLEGQPEDFRIFIPQYLWYMSYEWIPHYLNDIVGIYEYLSPKPIVEQNQIKDPPPNSVSWPMIRLAFSKFYAGNFSGFHGGDPKLGKLLGLMNCKYVLVHNDIIVNPNRPDLDPRIERSKMSGFEGLSLEKTFGKVDFYRNEYFAPRVYAAQPSQWTMRASGLEGMMKIVERDDFVPGESVLFLLRQPSWWTKDWMELKPEQRRIVEELTARRGTDRPKIEFERTNPTRYVVHVDSSGAFFLVFSESYHPHWVAYVDGEEIPSDHHFIANGYANAWYIDRAGSYDVVLEFWPQRLLRVGVAVSLTTCAACVVCLAWERLKSVRSSAQGKRASPILSTTDTLMESRVGGVSGRSARGLGRDERE